MKTKNNVQKTVLKTMAVIVSLALVSPTLSAQGLWKSLIENNSFNTIVLALADDGKTANVTGNENFPVSGATTYAEPTEEEELELESWMVNESYFPAIAATSVETESPMELEGWMTAENYFPTVTATSPETENPLEMENWMTGEHFFGKNTTEKTPVTGEKTSEENRNGTVILMNNNKFGKRILIVLKDSDNALKLEQWMVDEKIWNR